MTLQPIVYHGRTLAAATPQRFFLADELNGRPHDDPERRFVIYMCDYAGCVLRGTLPGPYRDIDARRYARACLIPAELLERPTLGVERAAAAFAVPVVEIRTELHLRSCPPPGVNLTAATRWVAFAWPGGGGRSQADSGGAIIRSPTRGSGPKPNGGWVPAVFPLGKHPYGPSPTREGVGDRGWVAKVVALGLVDAVLVDVVARCLVLDNFGDCLHPEAPRDRDQGIDDELVGAVGGAVGDEQLPATAPNLQSAARTCGVPTRTRSEFGRCRRCDARRR